MTQAFPRSLVIVICATFASLLACSLTFNMMPNLFTLFLFAFVALWFAVGALAFRNGYKWLAYPTLLSWAVYMLGSASQVGF